MSMKDWAEREIEIACKYEKPDREEGAWDYGCACYESALKAFKSLMEDGHSGISIGFTKHILNRLIDGKPLVPIEDTDDVWEDRERYGDDDERKSYQCKRMSSLFKYVYPDGTVKYLDVDRVRGVNLDNPNIGWHSRITQDIVEEIFPLTMPYMPADDPYEVYCDELLTDPMNGDFDTIAIYYIAKPDGEKVDVNRYFKDGNTVYGGWDEISQDEYEERKEIDRKRRQNIHNQPEILFDQVHVKMESHFITPTVRHATDGRHLRRIMCTKQCDCNRCYKKKTCADCPYCFENKDIDCNSQGIQGCKYKIDYPKSEAEV